MVTLYGDLYGDFRIIYSTVYMIIKYEVKFIFSDDNITF